MLVTENLLNLIKMHLVTLSHEKHDRCVMEMCHPATQMFMLPFMSPQSQHDDPLHRSRSHWGSFTRAGLANNTCQIFIGELDKKMKNT